MIFGKFWLWHVVKIHSYQALSIITKTAKYASKLVKKYFKKHARCIHTCNPYRWSFPIPPHCWKHVAGCLLERTLPWQRKHGPDLSKKAWVAVSVIHPGLRFQKTRNLKPNIYLGFICFHDFICFLRFFCPLTHCLLCFTSFFCTGSICIYILIFQLFHLVHGTSLYQFPIDFEVVSAPTGAGKWSTWFYESSRLVGRELQSRNPEDCAVWVSHFGNAKTLIRPMNLIWKDALQHKHVSGVISNRCVLKVWSFNIIMLTARNQQIIGIGWIFLAQAAFAFFGQMGQVASSNLATPKSTGHCWVCACHSPEDDLWMAAWHH